MIAATLTAYLVALLAIGLWAGRRIGDSGDFHLAGRQLGPVVASLSASASSSSVWTLLGVSGAAYAWGLPAFWLIPAVLSGFLINWSLVAPRLQRASGRDGTVTLVEFLARGCNPGAERLLRAIGAVLILFCFSFYVAAQFQGAGSAIATSLPGAAGNAGPLSEPAAIVAGALVVVVYVLLGGFWAASVTDALQGLMMMLVAVVLPVTALVAVGGPASLLNDLLAAPGAGPLNQPSVLLAAVFVAGLFGIGLGYPGQPHVVNRFMAMRDSADIGRARIIALVWAGVIYTGMVVLGWCGRVLLPAADDPESVLLELAVDLLPPLVSGAVAGGVLAAIMSTADSQLLVAGGAASHDLRRQRTSVTLDRLVLLAVGAAAVLLALLVPERIFVRVLFAWQVLGNAFGPLLLVLLWRGPVADGYRIAAMVCGAGLTMVLSLLPDAPGDAAERLLPFIAALLLALAGSRRFNAPTPSAPGYRRPADGS